MLKLLPLLLAARRLGRLYLYLACLAAAQTPSVILFRDPPPLTPCATAQTLVNVSTSPPNVWTCKANVWTLAPLVLVAPPVVGPPGPQGPIGPQGPQGIPGPQAMALTGPLGPDDSKLPGYLWSDGVNVVWAALAIPRATPASSAAPCFAAGQMSYDAGYLYLCRTAGTPGVWTRIPMLNTGF